MDRWASVCGRWLLVLTVVFGIAGAYAACAPNCATSASVTTMAGGFPPKVMPAADDIDFMDAELTLQGIEAVKQLAQQTLQYAASLPPRRWRLRLHVNPDASLAPKAARTQVKLRKQRLLKLLIDAGIKKSYVVFV